MLKKIISLLMLFSFFPTLHGQSTIKTKEIKISNAEGIEIFNICISGCSVKFTDNNEYYWYTEFSKIKSTRGGSGGDLLHGNYKRYDEQGNLRREENYFLGLQDGVHKTWDATGKIISEYRYKKGLVYYLKFLNEEKYWIEFTGPMFEIGSVRKIYDQFNRVVSEQLIIEGEKQRVRTYYEGTAKIKEEYISSALDPKYYQGKYVSYYPNGKVEFEGQFQDGLFSNIQIGVWKWYHPDGTLDYEAQFKSDLLEWPNGELRHSGGYYLDDKTGEWVKHGEWQYYDENGKRTSSETYSFGDLIKN